MHDSDALHSALGGSRPRRRLSSVTLAIEPIEGTPGVVRYRWDADTEILSASVVDRRGGGSVATAVELEGSDGSWVTLELRAGRFCGVEVAVWPPVKARSTLAPPTRTITAHAVLPLAAVAGAAALGDVEVDTLLSAESDRMERTFHLRVGPPRRSRAVRVGRDILLELDEADQLAGLWLLNVPPVPIPS